MKAAHADVGGAPWLEIRVAHLFRPTYDNANEGHPSDFLGAGWDRGVKSFLSVTLLQHATMDLTA
jgi:hypothetical protein